MPINHVALGAAESITLSLSGNNGVHFDEIRLNYADDSAEYTWLFLEGDHGGWLDGDSSNAAILPEQTLYIADANPHLSGSGYPIEVTTVTSDVGYADTSSTIYVTFYGDAGHVGPLTLGNSFARDSTDTISFDIGNIGEFQALKLYNSGNNGWHLGTLQVTANGGDTLSWGNDAWLDGDGSSPESPHSQIFYASAALVVGSGDVVTQVHLATSFLEYANTGDDVFITVTGTTGASDETVVNGVAGREGMDVQVIHADIGQFESIQVRLGGNNGLHLHEIRVDFAQGSSGAAVYSWLLNDLNGWLDGDSEAPPSRVYAAADASPVVEGTGNAVTVTTVTGTRNNAQSNSLFIITLYGTNGHTPPTTLSSGFANGATDVINYDIGDIGDFVAAKIWNTGNDGWRLETLTINIGGNDYIFAYDQWIDGNGSTEQAPHAELFYADGSWSSQGGVSMAEIQIMCPSQTAACMADATCVSEFGTALAGGDIAVVFQDPSTWSGAATPGIMACLAAGVTGGR